MLEVQMTAPALRFPLLAVNVGVPAKLGEQHGEPVISAIRKTPVRAADILLCETNLDGDRQADLTVHGGRDKAVYAYSALHWPFWKKNLGFEPGPASFGENLTLDRADEDEVRIGDVFAWADARLQITQPRQPCFKFAMMHGRLDLGAALIKSGRCGFYLRVLHGGWVPVADAILDRLETDERAPSVRSIFHAFYDKTVATETLAGFAATPALSDDWRAAFEERIARRRGNSIPAQN